MTQFEYIHGAYKIMEDSFSENRKEFIKSKLGLQSAIYCSFVTFVSNYLHGYSYYNNIIDEMDDMPIDSVVLSYADALYAVLKSETDICLKKDVCLEIVKYLEENKNNIELYITKEN